MKTQSRLTRSLSFAVLFACLLALPAPAPTFAQEAYTLAIAGGDGQSACLTTAFADPLLVTVKDASLTAVEGVVVTFAAPASGASTDPAGFTVTTDASGAADAAVTANTVMGDVAIVASIEGGGDPLVGSVTFHLHNLPCRPSFWMEDPLDPGRPAPPAGTDPATPWAGWWWRDTTNQNALWQHTAEQFTDAVIPVWVDDTGTRGVYVYSAAGGGNVAAVVDGDEYMIVGCGGGRNYAVEARSRFAEAIPGFTRKSLRQVVVPEVDQESYWGCSSWTRFSLNIPLYANAAFLGAIGDWTLVNDELNRRQAWTYGTDLAWGLDGFLGAGSLRDYRPDAAFKHPISNYVSAETALTLGTFAITLIPTAGGELLTSLPDQKVVIVPSLGQYLPDAGSLRGRSPRIEEAIADLQTILDLQPDALVPLNGLPVVGPAQVAAAATAQRDALDDIRLQTVQQMNQGMPEDEIAAAVALPADLAANPYNREFAGAVPFLVHAIYHEYLGWFGGNPLELAPTLTEGVKAQVLADALGGLDNLIATATTAELNARDVAAAERALYLARSGYVLAAACGADCRPEPLETARRVYAQALRKNAYLAQSAQVRNYYLSEAQALGPIIKVGNEDTPIAFSGAEVILQAGDLNSQCAKILSLPANGTLTLAGSTFAVPTPSLYTADLDTLVFTPAENWHGETSFVFSIGGPNASLGEYPATIYVSPVNDAPAAAAAIPHVAVDEDAPDTVIDLAGAFADVDGDALTFTAESSAPGLATPAIDAATLALDYGENLHGAATITVTATDPAGEFSQTSFDVTVSPVNDAPAAVSQDLFATAGLERTITLDYGDVETAQAELVFQLTVPPSHGALTGAAPALAYMAGAGYTGDDSFTYTVGDGELTSQATVTIHVVQTSIAGQVYDDANANGILDEGEGGLSGVTVQLRTTDDSVVAEATTGTDGSYAFGSLVGAAYRVAALVPPGYLQTTPDPADIDLADGQALTGIAFGMVYSADLRVSMTASVNGDTIVYTMVVANDGLGDALEAILTGPVPEGTSKKSVITTYGTCKVDNVLVCSFGAMPAGSAATITFQVKRKDAGIAIVNTVTIASSIFDIDLSDNSATVTVP